ncbi:MAG: RDD family protein [Mycolicibacterium hassiacum]|nr:RDD family protein [Mycolicibacterium hassiacum]PZN24497.1 MAG: transporter [Mycolicibacterium hassiacum]
MPDGPAQHAPPVRALPRQAYTPWSVRVAATLLDWAPIWVVVLVPFIGLLIAGDLDCIDSLYGSGTRYCSEAVAAFWGSVQFIALVPAVVYFLWNVCYRQGRTGQSVGKSKLNIKLVHAKTWQPIGFWRSLLRQVAHYIDWFICYIGFLWPLWDRRRQTLADKIVGTVCVPVDMPPPWSLPPPQPAAGE